MPNELLEASWLFFLAISVYLKYSKAGFSNTRQGSIPICFYCNLQPRPEPCEDLFRLHADLCPHCPFVRIKNRIIVAFHLLGYSLFLYMKRKAAEFVPQRAPDKRYGIKEVEQIDVKALGLPAPALSCTSHNRRPLIVGARRPSLKRRKSDLIKKYACQRCNSRPRQILFVPCYHFYSCETCAEDTEECQRCQQPILRKVKIYRS